MSDGASSRERALAFVVAHGDAPTRARARALCGELAGSEALATLPEPEEDAPAAAWLATLAFCGDVRAMRDPRVERACVALARAQAEDGGFDAGGAEDARLQLSGTLGGYLARSPYVRPAALAALGDFLTERWSPERVKGARWENLASYAHFFANADHDAGDGILQWCGRELERGFRAGVFDAARTARVLVLCDAHALPGARLEREELLRALDDEQAPDGGFSAPEDPTSEGVSPEELMNRRVERSLEALSGLVRLA